MATEVDTSGRVVKTSLQGRFCARERALITTNVSSTVANFVNSGRAVGMATEVDALGWALLLLMSAAAGCESVPAGTLFARENARLSPQTFRQQWPTSSTVGAPSEWRRRSIPRGSLSPTRIVRLETEKDPPRNLVVADVERGEVLRHHQITGPALQRARQMRGRCADDTDQLAHDEDGLLRARGRTPGGSPRRQRTDPDRDRPRRTPW